MKSTFKEADPIYKPKELAITIETAEEERLLTTLFAYNDTVPKELERIHVLTKTERESLRNLMVKLANTLMYPNK